MLFAARLVTLSHRLAVKHSALASTGIMTVGPGSVNTIPGSVRFSLDIRAPSDATVDALEEELKAGSAALASGADVAGLLDGGTTGLPLHVKWQTDSISPATKFHPDCIAAVRASAISVLGDERLAREMTSGAGHDSVYASRRCPTSMIFVPCRNGVSHNPEEYTSPEDCALGAQVLCQSVLRYDRMRSREGNKAG